jgi:hypothetical protein
MFPKHALQPTSMASFLIAAILGGLCSSDSFSQEPSSQDARTRSDKQGRIVGLTYLGQGGLRQSAPKDVSSLTNVVISYGTTLTRDDIEFLASLQNVEELSFGGNLDDEYVAIEGDLSPLGKLKRLESVFLCKRDMRDSDLAFLRELPNLRSLEFLAGPNPFHENGSSVTDACAESIGQARNLRWLEIYNGDKLSDRFIEGISQHLEELEHLHLGSDNLTDRSLQLLAKQFGNLKSIDLYSKQFTDQGVAFLASAKQLQKVWLECPLLTNESVSVLTELRDLRHLLITAPTVTNEVVEKVAKLPELQILCLRNTPLSDEQFAMFANHPKLESIFANGRNLTTENVLQVIATTPRLEHMTLAEAKATQDSVNRFLAARKSASDKSDK